MDLRKIKIQKQFRDKMGLIVNVPKHSGSGSGQVMMEILPSVFFSNPKLSSEITGINLIVRQ